MRQHNGQAAANEHEGIDGPEGLDQVNVALRAPFHPDALERAAAAIGVEAVGTADRLSGL